MMTQEHETLLFRMCGPLREECPDCGVKIGQLHRGSCEIERCPRCGGSLLTCDCGDEVPWSEFIQVWECRFIPWKGYFESDLWCIEYGFFGKPPMDMETFLLVPCGLDDPEARIDRVRLWHDCVWDQHLQKMVLCDHAHGDSAQGLPGAGSEGAAPTGSTLDPG